MAASSAVVFNEETTCHAIGASVAKQQAATKILEKLLILHLHQPVQSDSKKRQDRYRRHGHGGAITEVEVAHIRLVCVNRHRFRCSSRSATGHHPDQIEDRKRLDEPENQGNENKGQQVWPRHVSKTRPTASAIDLNGLVQILRDVLQCSQQNNEYEGK